MSSFNGRSRTATGHTYQTRIGTMVWGAPYWQFFAPSAEQRHLSTNKVELKDVIYTPYYRIEENSVSVDPVDKITEGEVNSRVNTYAAGAVDVLVLRKNGHNPELPVSTYNSYASAVRVEATNLANSSFREGHY